MEIKESRLFIQGGYGMFPRNENRNEGTFACSPERKPERGYIRQSHPFMKPPFCLPVIFEAISSNASNLVRLLLCLFWRVFLEGL